MPAPANRKVPYVLALREFFYRQLCQNIEAGPFKFFDKTMAQSIELNLTSLLGVGVTGSVHTIDPDSSGLHDLGLPPKDYVAKIPHAIRFTGGYLNFPHANIAQRLEVRFLEIIRPQIFTLEASSFFPKNPAWIPGTLPIAEIVKLVRTNKGIILIKRNLRGVTPADIWNRYGESLPPEILDGLKDIYDLAQAMFESVLMPGAHPLLPKGLVRQTLRRPFLLDINLTNLIWIEDPRDFQDFGLKRAGFVFCEFAEHPSPRYISPNLSFKDFVEEILIAAKFEAKRSNTKLIDAK